MIAEPVALARFVPVGNGVNLTSLSGVQSIVVARSAPVLLLSVQAENVRMTVDGSVPSASVGLKLMAGQQPMYMEFVAETVIKLIEESASATIYYQAGRWE